MRQIQTLCQSFYDLKIASTEKVIVFIFRKMKQIEKFANHSSRSVHTKAVIMILFTYF